MKNFKTVGQLENKLWANEISQDLGLRGVSTDIPQISYFQDFTTFFMERQLGEDECQP